MPFALTSQQPPPRFGPIHFGQINLERFYDNEGAQHSYMEINLSKNRYDYYFTHQLNSVQSSPIPGLVTLTERYEPQDLTRPTVFNAFKRDLLEIVKQAAKSFPQWLDGYSQDELASVQTLLTRPDSYIRKSTQGDYFLSIPHSNNALRSLEGLPPPSSTAYVPWPPHGLNPSMGTSNLQTATSNPALTQPAINPSTSPQQPLPAKAPETGTQANNPPPTQTIDSTPWS